MKHAISVGMGFGKKSFHDAVLAAHSDDVIVIDPGEYHADDGFTIGQCEIRGTGDSPRDVIIHTNFSVKDGCNLSLDNLTLIRDASEGNVVNVKPGGHVAVSSCVITAVAGPNYPVIYMTGGTAELTASEVRHQSTDDSGMRYGLYMTEGSRVTATQCDITKLMASGSVFEGHTTQVQNYCATSAHGEITADALYIDDARDGYFQLSATEGSVIAVQQLFLPNAANEGRVTDSQFTAGQTNIGDGPTLTLTVKGNYDINVPGAELELVQPTEPEADPEPAPDPEPVPAAPEPAEEAPEQEEKPALDQLHEMIGLSELKDEVDKFIKVEAIKQKQAAQGVKVKRQSLHSMFLGNPGTGKTTVARLMAKALQENGVIRTTKLVEVTRDDLITPSVGGTAPKTKKVLESALGGVLFIDEAYTLYQEGGGINYGQEAVDTIIKYMEDHKDDIMIIFAGYTKEMQDFMNMNRGMQSRIPHIFHFADYTAPEIAEIGRLKLHAAGYKFDEAHYTQAIQRAYQANIDHGNGRWAENYNGQLTELFLSGLTGDETGEALFAIPNAVIDELAGGDQADKDAAVDELLAEVNGLIGLADVKAFVNDLVKRVRLEQQLGDQLGAGNKPAYHMVFTGAPGTGKTTVARLIAKLFYNLGILPKDTVAEVARPDLVGRYVGETEDKTGKVIRDAMGGVLFVDEAYQLTQGSDNDFGKQAVETFITELENNRDKFVAIFAGYTSDMRDFLEANAGLRSRIPLTIEFADYTPDEVAQIVTAIVTANWTVNEPLLQQVVSATYAALPAAERSNGRWARTYADELIAKHKLLLAEQLPDHPDLDIKAITDAELAPDETTKGAKDEAVQALLAQLDGLVGLDSVKAFVNDLVARIQVEKKLSGQIASGAKPTYHMVFSGAPGTGKTTVARIIGQLFYNLGILPKATVLEVSRPDLVGSYIGETEKKTAKVIRDAMGGVLFVDEAYQLTQGSGNDFGKQAVETFITELENNRDQFVAIFAGYTDDMDRFLDANAGLRSRIPLTLTFEAYTPEQVAQIVGHLVEQDWSVNSALLRSVVINRYKNLPLKEQGNGRWARQFAERLINQHKLWLGQQDLEAPGFDAKHIQDDLLFASMTW